MSGITGRSRLTTLLVAAYPPNAPLRGRGCALLGGPRGGTASTITLQSRGRSIVVDKLVGFMMTDRIIQLIQVYNRSIGLQDSLRGKRTRIAVGTWPVGIISSRGCQTPCE